MKKTLVKNIETGVEKECDILRKNTNILEVVIKDTTIKILLKKHQKIYLGNYKGMEFQSTGD